MPMILLQLHMPHMSAVRLGTASPLLDLKYISLTGLHGHQASQTGIVQVAKPRIVSAQICTPSLKCLSH